MDRRAFVARMAALTSVAAAPSVASLVDAPPAPARPPDRLADPTHPAELTIAEAATLIRRGRLSPVDLVDACLDRVERLDPELKTFNFVNGDAARRRARELAGRRPRTPLHGIPLLIKDNHYTSGIPTTANSWLFTRNPFTGGEDFVPEFDAAPVERLQAAGAIVLGKGQMGPLANFRGAEPDGTLTTVNAWTPDNIDYTPGGSSSGPATAVAARLVTSSIGTETSGSIITPSALQALTGFKPTLGRVSLYGVIPLSYTRDHGGPLARDALDAAIMMQAMAGPDPRDPRTLGLPPLPDLVRAATRRSVRPLRIGVLPDYPTGGDATPQASTLRRRLLDTLADAGLRIVDVPYPDDWEVLVGAFNEVRHAERTELFLDRLREDPRLFGVVLPDWIVGLFVTGDEFLRGQRAKLVLLERVLDQVFERCDVVVQTDPTPFDIVGLPAITFPIGFTTDQPGARGAETPYGAILGAPPYAEDDLIAVAAAVQARTGFHRRRPPGAGDP